MGSLSCTRNLCRSPVVQKLATWLGLAARQAGKCSLFSKWPSAQVMFKGSSSEEEGTSGYWGTAGRLLAHPGLGQCWGKHCVWVWQSGVMKSFW